MAEKIIGILTVGLGIFIVIMLIAKAAWETVKCPHCLEGINRSAKVCKHCGRDV